MKVEFNRAETAAVLDEHKRAIDASSRIATFSTPEARLLLGLCTTPLSTNASALLTGLANDRFDWPRFFRMSAEWQVDPVVTTNLVAIGSSDLPEDVVRRATVLRLSTRATLLSRVLVMNGLLSKLEAANIAAIVLKGSATSVSAYGDPTLRTSGDIDLLVRRDDIMRARDIIFAAGYQRTYHPSDERRLIDAGHALELMGPHNIKVELHATLLSKHLRIPFDMEDVWRKSREVTSAGRTIRILAPDPELVFLCAHGGKHGWNELRWICDIAQIVSRLTKAEAASAAALARSLRAAKLVALGLDLAARLFGVTGDATLETIRKSFDLKATEEEVLRNLALRVEPNDDSPPTVPLYARLHHGLPAVVFWMSLREHLSDRVMTLADLISGSQRSRP